MTVRTRVTLALLAVVGMIGAVLVVVGLTAGQRGAAPVAAAETRAPVTVAPPSTSAAPRLAASPPTRIAIPAIGVDSVVNPSGLNPDGTLEVPAPGPRYDEASWYTGSASPGQDGPSVILGHIDSARNGPSVFYALSKLQPLDEFTVTLADGAVLVFRVNSVQQYAKDAFPTQEVYGPTPRPEMRLITCGGPFDDSARSYRDNTVVYASRIV